MKRNIFSEKISAWQCAPWLPDARHEITTIGAFIEQVKAGTYADNVQRCRNEIAAAWQCYAAGDTAAVNRHLETYKAIKASSPVAMLAGINEERKNDTFTAFSSVLCIDIDAPKPGESNGNNVRDWEELKRKISVLPYVAFCALSAGGRGLFVLVPIADPAKYSQYYEVWAQLFAKVGLFCDAACKNANRLRYMTHDPAPYCNYNAEVWEQYTPPTQPHQPARRNEYTQNVTLTEADREQVRKIVQYCEAHKTVIADNYSDWVRLSAFFAHCYPDAEGQELFHRLAALSEKYKAKENYRIFQSLQRPAASECGFGTFLHIAEINGIPIQRSNKKRSEVIARGWKPERGTTQTQSEEKPTEQQEQKPCNESPQNVTPPPVLSQSEQTILERAIKSGYIAEGQTALNRMQEQNPNIKTLCSRLDMHYLGHQRANGQKWHMTKAQFEALLFSYKNMI